MALSEIDQIKKVLEDSKYILLVFPTQSNGDALSAATALKLFFERSHKQADIVVDNFILPKNLKFLPGSGTVKKELSNLQKFIIKVDVSKAPIETLSYDVKDNWLSIYLTPKQGVISKNELRTAQTTFKYDLVITLNTPDLESLGGIFYNNTDLFYRVPTLNIDYQASNERYGQINLIDLTSTSVSEAVYKMLKQIPTTPIDGELSTALLTGMIIATKSFKNPNLTPHTLHLASQLITSGAEREKIVHQLYRTRSIATLKLWGQALTHLEHEPRLSLLSTTITREDFSRTGASVEDINGIIEELMSNSPEAKIILLLYEFPESMGKNKIGGVLAVDKNFDALSVVKPLNPQGNKKQATFSMDDKTLKEAEEMVKKIIAETSGGRQ